MSYANIIENYNSRQPEKTKFNNVNHNYHSVTFDNLEPNTLYAYRVGNGKIWSEWIQFRNCP